MKIAYFDEDHAAYFDEDHAYFDEMLWRGTDMIQEVPLEQWDDALILMNFAYFDEDHAAPGLS